MDHGTSPFWRLKYLPQAVLVTPAKTVGSANVFKGEELFEDVQHAFPVCPCATKYPLNVHTLDDQGRETVLRVRCRNVPLGDAYAVTDFFVQGCSFKDDCWTVDLCPPPTGIKCACLFVILMRYKSMDHIRLLHPLYNNTYEKAQVIKAFTKAATIHPDLDTESKLQTAAAQCTREQHTALFQEAQRLVDSWTANRPPHNCDRDRLGLYSCIMGMRHGPMYALHWPGVEATVPFTARRGIRIWFDVGPIAEMADVGACTDDGQAFGRRVWCSLQGPRLVICAHVCQAGNVRPVVVLLKMGRAIPGQLVMVLFVMAGSTRFQYPPPIPNLCNRTETENSAIATIPACET
ncbi:hypothetical protein VOLCADRAFT_92119 [Volvox carteri f. nagariensis]|uniref:Uncharacterized protein n=1 Tax=Volvox carteri f. nagariensis TaxID=3068 RepID=D8TYN1_VOLCA|nr:uncharacterized protein VOLCADRAFT_92119 [Volvox carteri f. nagariensis]EFJ47341.1 hypothetical protein VOLCADRAFT_92119 [Volvox carteri f. nagariensis]|eukprot:XP_002951530.1 hypothetical protein VOLCADRAFT_92119 [Volvox carteri f. nagariensis]